MAALALIRRELLTVLRSKRAFAMQLGIVAAVAWFVMRAWPHETKLVVSSAQMTSISDALSRLLTLALALGGFLALTPLAGAAITTERERDTWSTLRLALLSPRGIVFAKVANLLGFYTLLVAGSLPVLGMIFFLVGVSWQDLLVRLLLVYAMVFTAASCGLYCSARFSRTITAVLAGFVLTLAVNGLAALVLIFLGSFFRGFIGDATSHFIVALVELLPGLDTGINGSASNAAFVFYAMAAPIFYLLPQGIPAATPLVGLYAALWQGLLGIFIILRAARHIERSEEVARVPKHREVLDRTALARRRRRFPYYLIDPRKDYPPIEDLSNPVMVKELRWGLLGRTSALVRIGYMVLFVDLVILGAISVELFSAVETVFWAGFFMIAASCLVIPLLLANIFTKEYEQDSVDMLRMTLVLPSEVVRGKLLGGAVTLVPLMIPGMALLLITSLFVLALHDGSHSVAMTLAALATFAVSAWLCLTVSLLASLLAKRTGVALLLSYALCATVFAGVSLAVWLGSDLLNFVLLEPGARIHPDSAKMVSAAVSPLGAFMLLSLGWSRPFSPTWLLWLASMTGFTFLGRSAFRISVRIFTARFYSG